MRHDFIQKVWDIRDEKYKIRDLLIEKTEKLKSITEELPKDMRKNGPRIPDINHTEFPEEKLMPKVETPEEEEVLELGQQKQEVIVMVSECTVI